MPQWYLQTPAFTAAGGRVVGTEGNDTTTPSRRSLGELQVGAGRVRILGTFLPWPTTQFPHNFGLSSYALTFNGYELAQNLFSWQRPGA